MFLNSFNSEYDAIVHCCYGEFHHLLVARQEYINFTLHSAISDFQFGTLD